LQQSFGVEQLALVAAQTALQLLVAALQVSPLGQPQSLQQVACVSLPLHVPSPQRGAATQALPWQVRPEPHAQSLQQVLLDSPFSQTPSPQTASGVEPPHPAAATKVSRKKKVQVAACLMGLPPWRRRRAPRRA
jgi:hypothetical protein